MATNNSINFTKMKTNDKEIINILQDIQNRKITKLDPSFVPTLGFSYPVIGHYISSLEEQISSLESCMKLGIFNKKSSISLLKCNSCNSLDFYNKFVCTLCKSSNIIRGITIGHDSCGNVDFDYKYMTLDGTLVCEKCNKKLKAIGVDYSKIGYFYKCLECSALLPDMDQHYLCLKCGTTSSSSEDKLQILHLYSYTVDLQKVAEKLNEDNFMISVVGELDKLGIKSTLTEVIYGISGLQHNFTLVTYDMKDLPFVIVDELESQENNNTKREAEIFVLSFITKCLDVKVPNKILLAIPSLKENLKELLRMNGIVLVEAETKDEAALDLAQIITEIYNRM
jgi:hypothetical protein